MTAASSTEASANQRMKLTAAAILVSRGMMVLQAAPAAYPYRSAAEARRMHDSSTCPVCRGLPVGGSMSDDEFFAFLAACRDELAAKQAGFQQRIAGASRWQYEMADGSLTVGDTRFGMTPIGSFSPQYQSWLWAWANEDFPEAARAASRRIQGLHAVTGFRVFLDPGIGASPEDAQDFTALAVHQLGAIGFFRCPSDGPVLYLAVHESGSQNAEPVAAADRGGM